MILETLVPALEIPRAVLVQAGLSSLGIQSWNLSINTLAGTG